MTSPPRGRRYGDRAGGKRFHLRWFGDLAPDAAWPPLIGLHGLLVSALFFVYGCWRSDQRPGAIRALVAYKSGGLLNAFPRCKWFATRCCARKLPAVLSQTQEKSRQYPALQTLWQEDVFLALLGDRFALVAPIMKTALLGPGGWGVPPIFLKKKKTLAEASQALPALALLRQNLAMADYFF